MKIKINLTRVAKTINKMTDNNNCKMLEPSYLAGGSINLYNHFKKVLTPIYQIWIYAGVYILWPSKSTVHS